MGIVNEILLAVLNSLWQAAAVTALAWMALRWLKKVNAATRYAIWWSVLAVALALPVAPPVVSWLRTRPEAPAAAQARPAASPAGVPLIEEPAAMVTLRQEPSAKWPWWIAGLWAGLCAYRLWQIGRSYLYLRGVKRRARLAPQALPAMSRSARVLLSNDAASPMAVGFLHPAVILPEGWTEELAPAELEHVLLHEAGHLARRDDWSNLLAKLLGAALALHPVAWWILRQIEHEREIACDDWVVARVGSARPYAESLARVSELRWARRQGARPGEALAAGMLGGGSRLSGRIELLLKRRPGFSPRMSGARVSASAALLAGCVGLTALVPQLLALAPEQPAFEAAAIKPSDPDHFGAQMFSPGPGRFTTMTTTLKDLVAFAYSVRTFQVSGGAGWISSAHYDITAKAAGAPQFAQFPLMLQTLLDGRFKLRLHRETRELPVLQLMAAKGGARLHAVESAGLGVGGGRGRLNGHGADMATLAQVLSGQLGRVVEDRTGLTGFYEFTLTWTPDEAESAAETGTSLFAALQDQLGLRLQAGKGPVEMLVIDHAEKPDEN